MIQDRVLYSHWVDVIDLGWPYANFTPKELACNKTGEFYMDRAPIGALQVARKRLDKPIYLNSAHRSWLHNIAVGGAPKSQHLKIAFDISLKNFVGMERFLYEILKLVGFTGFGFYNTFIHVDMGRGRMWFGSDSAYAKWSVLLAAPIMDVTL